MGSSIKNRTLSCLGSLFVTLGSILVFGVILVIVAGQLNQAAERDFARKQAAGQVPSGPALNTVEPMAAEEDGLLLDDPLADEEAAALAVDELGTGERVIVENEEIPAVAEDHRPVRLVIPMLNLDAPVKTADLLTWQEGTKRYTQWTVPNEYAAGWHSTSARPGEPGNMVLNGHHNINGEVFRDLINLPVGEQIILYDDQRQYTYRVTEMELLPEKGIPLRERLANGRWIQPTSDERLTLVTCWPYTSNTHRLIVVAQPVDH